jgi:hypothetical protein
VISKRFFKIIVVFYLKNQDSPWMFNYIPQDFCPEERKIPDTELKCPVSGFKKRP